MVSRAPKGGLVSHVNGQRYEGGEFTPDHGLFCGKGKNRVTKEAFDALAEKVAAAGKVLTYNEKTSEFVVLYPNGTTLFRAMNLKTLARCF